MKLDIGQLGIISSQQKSALECYIDERLFKQRKQYFEYTVESLSQYIEVKMELPDLMRLSENFSIKVNHDSVSIEEY